MGGFRRQRIEMSAHSAELQFRIVRKHNRFLYKGRTQDGRQFSREAGNVYNRNTFRASALGDAVLSVEVTKTGAAEVVSRAEPLGRKGPYLKRTLVKGGRSKVKAALEAGGKETGRTDLQRIALARYRRIHAAQQRSYKK